MIGTPQERGGLKWLAEREEVQALPHAVMSCGLAILESLPVKSPFPWATTALPIFISGSSRNHCAKRKPAGAHGRLPVEVGSLRP